MLLPDNTMPHLTRITESKILDLGWSLLPYPLYLSALTSRDFHLLHFLQNALNDHEFSQDQVKTFLENFELETS